MDVKQYGVLEQVQPRVKDWRAGGLSGATKHLIREDGDYTDFLPDVEYQKAVLFDTMGCVSFSALNCIETTLKAQYGLERNFSDRFTAKMSGTTKNGNYFAYVADSIRTQGAVPEDIWPFPRKQVSPAFTWDDYYTDIPDEIRAEGLKWLEEWKIEWEWVPMRLIDEYLKYGPIQVGVRAWPKPDKNGIYTDGGSIVRNHGVELFNKKGEDYYQIYDHYDKTVKNLDPNYDFRSAIQFTVTKIDPNAIMPTITLPDDVLVQEVEQSGSFALHLNGKLIIDDLDKLIASWLMRNKGDVREKTIAIKRVDWDSFDKVDLKNNPL